MIKNDCYYDYDFLTRFASILKALAERSDPSRANLPWAILTDDVLCCRLCKQSIQIDVRSIVDHGIVHLKEHNLIAFL